MVSLFCEYLSHIDRYNDSLERMKLYPYDLKYKTVYTEDKNDEDFFPVCSAITKYYTDDEESNLICIEEHYKTRDSLFNFTDFGRAYFHNAFMKVLFDDDKQDVDDDTIDWDHDVYDYDEV